VNNELSALTADQALDKLRQKVSLRDQMSGDLYYNILNGECCELANKCLKLGCDTTEIESILGQGTFVR
jgi:hypothetical protein